MDELWVPSRFVRNCFIRDGVPEPKVHVVPNGEGWAVKKEGNERVSSTHETQKAAIDAAREMAKEGDELVIHRAAVSRRRRKCNIRTWFGSQPQVTSMRRS